MTKIKNKYRYLVRRWGKVPVSLTLALGLVLVLVAAAIAAAVDPIVIPGAQQPGKNCSDVFPGTFEIKFDPAPDGTYSKTEGNLTVTVVKPSIEAGSLNSFDFTATFPVLGVIVKDGVDGANVYDYTVLDPPGIAADTYLTTPNDGDKGISHISFCYLVPDFIPPEVTKTAVGTYDREVTWELEKSVDPDSHSGFAGQIAGESTWEVVATKSETLINFKVVGTITIVNPNDFEIDFMVADELDDGTVAVVTCPTYTIPAIDQVVCTYEAFPDDGSATLNTATVTVEDQGDVIATADVEFIEDNLIGYDEGTLSDPRFDFEQIIPDSTTVTFDEEFVCSADADDYEDGEYTDTFVNWAYLNDNINLAASAEVEILCTLPKLIVEKTAVGSYDRTVTWELEKSVDPDSHTGFAGQIAGESTWVVVATKSETLDNYKVEGTITIDNPAAIPQTFTVIDELDDGTVADVTCPSYTVPAGGQVECTYEAFPDDDAATLNTATVSAVGNEDVIATAEVEFEEKLIGFDEGTLSDPRFDDFEQIISDTTTVMFDEEFVCSADADKYEDGEYTETFVNWAYLNGNINLAASATVEILCTLPELEVEKTAVGSYDRIVEWDLDKTVDPDNHSGLAGQIAGSSIWEVVATKYEEFDNYKVEGTITIDNPAAIPQTFTVIDELDDGTVADVTCPSYIVPAGGLVVCTYEAFPDDDAATLNTATVTAVGNDPVEAEAVVSFTEKLVGYDEGTLEDLRFDFEQIISDSTTKTFPETFVCPPSRDAVYDEDGTYTFTETNIVTLNGNIGLEAEATVTIYCEDYGHKSGVKWNDLNADGIWQMETEPILPDWEIHFINLDDLDEDPIPVFTDEDGYYEFDEVLPGVNYAVCEVLQENFVQTFPLEGIGTYYCADFDTEDITYGPVGYMINLGPGEIDDNNDFGNFKPLGCCYTQGYWKTHSAYGPAGPPDPTWESALPPEFDGNPETSGPDTEFFTTGVSWINLFWRPPAGGNAYIILAHQYMAAYLNINNDDPLKAADPTLVADTMADAFDILEYYADDLFIPASDRAFALELASFLDMYNNGMLPGGPPHCD